LSSRQ